MHIVCPHCTTSYAINPATLGENGRTARRACCKQVWLARPDEAVESAAALAVPAEANHARQRDIAAEWGATTETEKQSPVVESPPSAADWSDGRASSEQGKADRIALVRDATTDEDIEPRGGWLGGLLNAKWPERGRPRLRQPDNRLRRHDRAGCGVPRLAHRGDAAATANRELLQAGRAGCEFCAASRSRTSGSRPRRSRASRCW